MDSILKFAVGHKIWQFNKVESVSFKGTIVLEWVIRLAEDSSLWIIENERAMYKFVVLRRDLEF